MSVKLSGGLTKHFRVHLIEDNSVYRVAVKTTRQQYDPSVAFAKDCRVASHSTDSEKVLVFSNDSLKHITSSERLKVLLAIASNNVLIKEEI